VSFRPSNDSSLSTLTAAIGASTLETELELAAANQMVAALSLFHEELAVGTLLEVGALHHLQELVVFGEGRVHLSILLT